MGTDLTTISVEAETRLGFDLAVRRDNFGAAGSIRVPEEQVDIWREYAQFMRCARTIDIGAGATARDYPVADRGSALWFSGGVEPMYQQFKDFGFREDAYNNASQYRVRLQSTHGSVFEQDADCREVSA